jgi:hypothetical protein
MFLNGEVMRGNYSFGCKNQTMTKMKNIVKR